MRARVPRVVLGLVLAGLGVLALVTYVLVGNLDDTGRRPGAAASGGLAGEWSGQGTASRCAGFDRCAGTRPITLTIDCTGTRCEVVPFDRRYGSPPLTLADGRYRAAGPIPPAAAPTCGGAPTSTALWRLELALAAGRLVGSYAESTQQSFDCGATGVAWTVVLERR
jgi:hypothetical protein